MKPWPCACSSAPSSSPASWSVSDTDSLHILGQVLAEGRTFHVGHHVEDEPFALAGIEETGDVGVAELGGDADFPEEPVGGDADQQLGMEDLERDLLAVGLPRQVDAGIPALADLALDLVPPMKRRGGRAPACPAAWSSALDGVSPMLAAAATRAQGAA